MIPGHEFVGVVVEVGENAAKKDHVKVGDRLISEQIVPCWDCRFCKRGEYWMCEKHDVYGFQNNVNGAFAEYMKYPKESVNHQVPKDLPLEKAILVEPFACSAYCVERAAIHWDDVVVLAGAGTLGLGMIGCAKLKSPRKLVVMDTKPERLELAKKFGADLVLNPLNDDVVKIVKEMTGGYGCDVYIEATGHPNAVVQDKVGAELFRQFQPLRLGVHHHQLPRTLQLGASNHSQAQCSGACENHDVIPMDRRALDTVGRTSKRLDEDGFFKRQILGDLVIDAFLGVFHVFGEGAVHIVLEAVDIVFLTHPIFPAFAKAAVPARNNLLRDEPDPHFTWSFLAAFSPTSTTTPTNSWPGIIGSLMYFG